MQLYTAEVGKVLRIGIFKNKACIPAFFFGDLLERTKIHV